MPDKQKDQEPSAKPQGTPKSEPDKSAPFFLDDQSWNIVARQWWARSFDTYRRAAILNTTGGSEALPPFPLRVEAPTLLLQQAVIVTGDRTNEGRLIQAVTFPWFEIIALLQKDPKIAYQISWEKWEEIIAGSYKKAGFEEVILTPRSGDHGRDVIAIKKALGTIRVIDQVKAYKPGHLVTGEEVSALWGVMQGDKASKGFLTTTSDFAPKIKDNPLIMEFIPSRLELINGRRLFEKLDELASRPKPPLL